MAELDAPRRNRTPRRDLGTWYTFRYIYSTRQDNPSPEFKNGQDQFYLSNISTKYKYSAHRIDKIMSHRNDEHNVVLIAAKWKLQCRQ